jgi:hypothetical protein
MRFPLMDFCLEDFPLKMEELRQQHNFRIVIPIEKLPHLKIETVNGLKVKSINLFAAGTHDKNSPLPAAGDGTIAFFEIETEDPQPHQ